MTRRDVLEGVLEVLDQHLQVRGVNEATHLFRDLKLDSIKQLTFVVELENHFRVCFDEGDESGLETIGDVVDLLEGRLSS